MLDRNTNPDYLNSFLDYSITILNKSPNSIKEYNYDLAMFLKFIKLRFKLTSETDFSAITISDIPLSEISKILIRNLLLLIDFSDYPTVIDSPSLLCLCINRGRFKKIQMYRAYLLRFQFDWWSSSTLHIPLVSLMCNQGWQPLGYLSKLLLIVLV